MNKTYTNKSGSKVLEYLSNDTIVLDLPFIMTIGRRLTKGMPYMKLEQKVVGNDIAVIRLLNFQDYEGVVYLNVQDLQTGRCYNIDWNMDYEGKYWLWSLADLHTIHHSTNKN